MLRREAPSSSDPHTCLPPTCAQGKSSLLQLYVRDNNSSKLSLMISHAFLEHLHVNGFTLGLLLKILLR